MTSWRRRLDLWLMVAPVVGLFALAIVLVVQTRPADRWFRQCRRELQKAGLGLLKAHLLALRLGFSVRGRWIEDLGEPSRTILKRWGAEWRGKLSPMVQSLRYFLMGAAGVFCLAVLESVVRTYAK